MVVVAIIGIITAVLFVSFDEGRKQSRDKVRMAELKELQLAERAMFLGEDWRAAAAQRATRGRAAVRQVLQVLPVPEAPADQALATPVKKVAAKKGAAGKGAAKKAPANKAAAKKAVPMPRARTTTPKAPPPAPTAKRPTLRKAR